MAARTWFNVQQAATYAGSHPETIRDALRAQELHGLQRVKGGNWRTTPEWVDAWLSGEEVVAA